MNTSPVSSQEQGGNESSGSKRTRKIEHLPLVIALVFLIIGGVFLLNRADGQARDTARKHHLQDIEDALYFARNVNGTFPPYNQSTWCGHLSGPPSEALTQIEQALREQNDLYAKPEKPFPTDPDTQIASTSTGYFYIKHSPASFELLANLEVDPETNRTPDTCSERFHNLHYNYTIASVWRDGS